MAIYKISENYRIELSDGTYTLNGTYSIVDGKIQNYSATIEGIGFVSYNETENGTNFYSYNVPAEKRDEVIALVDTSLNEIKQ